MREAVLCFVGCLTASLFSTHKMPVAAFPNCDNQKYLQTFNYFLGGEQTCTPLPLKTTAVVQTKECMQKRVIKHMVCVDNCSHVVQFECSVMNPLLLLWMDFKWCFIRSVTETVEELVSILFSVNWETGLCYHMLSFVGTRGNFF